RCFLTRYASLRVPQFSVFSILPPFSAQVCSMPEITFLISSSGVAGRVMKIKSYKRSSMIASFLSGPRLSRSRFKSFIGRPARADFLLLFFRLVLGRLAPVVLIHRGVDSLLENHFHSVRGLRNHFGGFRKLGLFHR